MYNVIFEADTRAGKLFDLMLLVAIIASVTAVCLETVPSVQQRFGGILRSVEWFFTILFTVEYLARLYCVRNRWAYALSFYGIVDLLAVLPLYVTLVVGGSASLAVLRSFRLLRVFRTAVWRARGKVIVFLAFVAIVVTVAGALMYEIEHSGNANSGFTSIPQSIYWAIVTMTTVGYGDIVPETTLGKFVAAGLILIGYSLIIVPTGFVSAEIIKSQTKSYELTRTCSSCLLEGHERDAQFCRRCGGGLDVD
jgi:voltage-gated potassium channel